MSGPSQMTAPRWGVPDWRDEGAYPGPDTPMQEWRWQFLRRRPDYRKFWSERVEEDFERSCRFAEWVRETHDANYPIPQSRYGWAVDGGFFEGATRGLDPSFPYYKPTTNTLTPGGGVQTWWGSYEAQKEAERRGIVNFKFDLSQPLSEQLERAKCHLEILQMDYLGEAANDGRNHIAKWRTYLRVIDARDDSASWGRIANEILASPQNGPPVARQVWERAQRVMFKIGR